MKDNFINLYTGTWSQPCVHAQKTMPRTVLCLNAGKADFTMYYIRFLSTKELKVDPQTKHPNHLYKLNQLHCLFIIPTWHFKMYMYQGVRHQHEYLDHTKGK